MGCGLLTLTLALAGWVVPPQPTKYSVSRIEADLPQELSGDVRAALSKESDRVDNAAGKAVVQLWLRAPLPLKADFQEQLDVKYPLEPGMLVGAIRYLSSGTDYRNQTVKPGAYTLRYAQQPQDGNHLGTAQYRDFVVLIPAAQDKSPDKISQEQALEKSKKASGTSHPAVLSLLPPEPATGPLPKMTHEPNLDLQILVAKAAGKAGEKTQDVPIQLVVVGHAPE
jgi:hypothetical protein